MISSIGSELLNLGNLGANCQDYTNYTRCRIGCVRGNTNMQQTASPQPRNMGAVPIEPRYYNTKAGADSGNDQLLATFL